MRRSARGRLIWVAPLALAVGGLLLSAISAPQVAASCNPNRGDFSPGVQQEAYAYRNIGSTVGGVYTNMFVYPHPFVYPVSGNTTLEAVELRSFASGGPWVSQAGWIEGYSTGDIPHPFVAWTSPYGDALLVYNGNTLSWGSTGAVHVYYNYPSSGYTEFSAFGDTYPGSNNGVALGYTPTDGRVEGITENIGSQMPGGYVSTSNAYFTGTHIYYSGAWNNMGGSGGTTIPSYYTGAATSSTREVIYDNYCAN
ncbi:MAG: hypothetical protein ACYCZN_01100 [Candidatus Dormibacteria bacterium]